MGRHSPWGQVQHSNKVVRGITIVSTASHGGLMATEKAAQQWFSPAALANAMRIPGYYCWEEDCQIDIAIYDAKSLWERFCSVLPGLTSKPMDEMLAKIKRSISGWYPDYLLAKGETPDPETYAIYKARKESERMRKERDPNHIVTAWGTWDTLVPGVIRVATADGKSHFVTEESYDKIRADDVLTYSLPLDHCEIIEPELMPSLDERFIPYVLYRQQVFIKAIESKPEEAVAEANGTFYGPRAKFNAIVKTACEDFCQKLVAKAGMTNDAATALIKAQVSELRSMVDAEFRECAVFTS